MKKIKAILIIISFFSLTSCSEKEQTDNTQKNNKQSLTSPSKTNTPPEAKQSPAENAKIPDIMTPLAGTDSCYEYVELIREPNDVETYRSFGDSILLKDSEPARNEHRTYIGIIGTMIKKNKSIADIRQAVLTACRTLQSEQKN